MDINLYLQLGFRKGKYIIKGQGKGTKEEPIIIEPHQKIHNASFIYESDLYIIFKNYDFYNFSVIKSKNVSFSNCTFIRLNIYGSSYVNALECEFSELEVNKSHSNLVESCEIGILKFRLSANNKFQNTKFPEKYSKKILQNTQIGYFKNFFMFSTMVFIILIGFAFVFLILPFFGIINLFEAFYGVLLISPVLLVIAIVAGYIISNKSKSGIYDLKTKKKFPSNIII